MTQGTDEWTVQGLVLDDKLLVPALKLPIVACVVLLTVAVAAAWQINHTKSP